MKPPLDMVWTVILFGGLALCGCAEPWRTRLTLPNRYSLLHGQLVVHSDFPLASQHRLLNDLTARRKDLNERLGLPLSDEPIEVYLFETADRFGAFMRLYHPSFPRRRAFFVETDTRLEVYAQWGDRVAEDLRHEVTHGYLHSVVPNLPLWLDEGLAEYFEVPRGHHGLNREHSDQLLRRLQHGDWQPDLTRLEQLDPTVDMTQEDYAESWAWVHFLLESRPEHRELLCGYLHDLRRDGSAEPLCIRLRRLVERPDLALVRHVVRLAAGSTPREPRREPTTR